jgi:hypothetical protein
MRRMGAYLLGPRAPSPASWNTTLPALIKFDRDLIEIVA